VCESERGERERDRERVQDTFILVVMRISAWKVCA